jgi:hypothetical protein
VQKSFADEDGEEQGEWVWADGLTAAVCTEEEREALAKAMEAAKATPTILLSGVEAGSRHSTYMDMYRRVDNPVTGKELCRMPSGNRGVWKQYPSGTHYLFYHLSLSISAVGGAWFVGDKDDAEAGNACGWITVNSAALTPAHVTEIWEVDVDVTDNDDDSCTFSSSTAGVYSSGKCTATHLCTQLHLWGWGSSS